jgi:hypothetical protein
MATKYKNYNIGKIKKDKSGGERFSICISNIPDGSVTLYNNKKYLNGWANKAKENQYGILYNLTISIPEQLDNETRQASEPPPSSQSGSTGTPF